MTSSPLLSMFVCALFFCAGSLLCLEDKGMPLPIKIGNTADREKQKPFEEKKQKKGIFGYTEEEIYAIKMGVVGTLTLAAATIFYLLFIDPGPGDQ
jgi:hypothetical protein